MGRKFKTFDLLGRSYPEEGESACVKMHQAMPIKSMGFSGSEN